jgi:5'-nucleotidase
MKILLTNDDGIDAEGLAALAESFAHLADVTVVAPRYPMSCCGHGVTTTKPIRFEKVRDNWYWVDGLPADCVRVGLMHLKLQPDWVLSGINHGGNLGVDIFMSGTVAAAREASLLGFPAVAISQYRNPAVDVPWSLSAERALEAWKEIHSLPLQKYQLWNINLPAVPASPIRAFDHENQKQPSVSKPQVTHCHPEPQPLTFHLEPSDEGLVYRSSYQARPRSEHSDVAQCFAGRITCSKLHAVHLHAAEDF